MIASLSFEFCTVDVYEKYLIAVMDEGITVKPEHNKVLLDIANTYYSQKPFGYITHRKHSYSVDPSVYFETSKIKNLKAFAIVSKDEINQMNAELEKKFLLKPLRHFKELKDAVKWINEMV
jgi:hypothetical protein